MKAPKLSAGPVKQAKYDQAASLARMNSARMQQLLGDRSEWPLKQILRTGIHRK